MVLVVVGLLNRDYLKDLIRGMNYRPSEEMGRILDKLDLTDRGEFVFKASQPMLSGRGEFNAHCRTDLSVETAVLGCYVDDGIYVYDVEAEELEGIRELTTAHELLHAVWARMSEGERRDLTSDLTHVFEDNQAILAEEIDGYETSEKQEELYVRAGTEVASLPAGLEKHYAEIFKNQDAVVGFYNKYIAVFRQIQAEMAELTGEMESLKAEIDSKTTEYEERAKQLAGEITSFNECAETAGCFNSQWAFNAKRGELVAEQEALEAMYVEIGEMVERYNILVEKYNEDVLYNDKLNSLINSNIEPVVVE